MNVLKWLANRRRPDVSDHYCMEWVLLDTPWFKLSTLVQLVSEEVDDYRPNECNCLLLLVGGRYMHTIAAPKRKVAQMSAPALRFYGKQTLYHIDLHPAESRGDQFFSLPGWMTAADVRFDTDKRAWFLVLTW